VTAKHLLNDSDAEAWLQNFKRAVERRDAEELAQLFTPDCDLQGRQYPIPVRGRDAVSRHWRECVFEHQRDNILTYEIWATREENCFVRWRSSYIWLPINGFVELDGVFRLSFDRTDDGRLICRELREWVDYHEVG
jgi:hypothetical protein